MHCSARPPRPSGPTCTSASRKARSARREIFGPVVADAGLPGTHIRIEGRVLDGEGNILPDALIEIWQADGEGRYAHPADGRPLASNSFRGFGRCPTAKDGTLPLRHHQARPRARPRRHSAGAAHQCRACSRAACSSGCSRASTLPASRPTPADPILALVPADRRDTLLAKPDPPRPQRLPLRHPPAGRGRDRVLRRLRRVIASMRRRILC